MSRKSHTHKEAIIRRLYDTGLKLSATDFPYSNANQYLVELERQDLITREWAESDNSRFKLNFITKDQREKAKLYLESADHHEMGDTV